jgi:DNA-binding CsgD family transcriptional regulator
MTVRREIVESSIAALVAGQSMVLRGPAGIGKTQTARAIATALTSDGLTVLRAFGSQSAQRIPLGALAGLLGVGEGTAADRVGHAVNAAASGSSVLVIDDAHLLDDESSTVVHHLVATGAVATLVTVRSTEVWPDAVRRLWRDGHAPVVDLGPLDRADTRAAAEELLGGVIDESTFELLVRAADGNPLLLAETITASRTADLISAPKGVWTGTSVAGGSGTEELLAARVSAWDEGERELAELVAVGNAVPVIVLDQLVGPGQVERAIAMRILRLGDRPGTIELSHPLLAERVRAGLAHTDVADLLDRLIDTALELDPADDLSVDVGRWALNLDDQRAIDASKLIRAAHRCHTIGRRELTQQLINAAERSGAVGDDLDLLNRLRAGQGLDPRVPEDDDSDAIALGAAEAFILGFGPLGDTRTRLRHRARLRPPSVERSELEALELGVSIANGAPLDPAIDELLDIVERHDPTAISSQIAASFATSALNEGARYETSLRVIEHIEAGGLPDNEFHRINLGVMRVDALRGLGRSAEASRLLVERCGPPEAPTSPIAGVLANASRLHEALDSGDPTRVQRLASSVLGVVGAFDSSGLGAYATGYLRWAQAWCREPHDDLAFFPSEHGLLLWPQAMLAVCHARAERGELVAARERAQGLADRSAASGHRYVAVTALHLVARITPTAKVAERITDIARRCEGERVPAVVAHVDALAHDDAVGLEKSAHLFEQLGQLALALESFRSAAQTHRVGGRRSSAQRCREEAMRLRDAGVMPSFAALNESEGEPLTAREREAYRFATEGRSNREIARHLGVSQRTVETHLQRAYRKLGSVAPRSK